MRDIKRVLWIDDVPGNLASQLFHDNETKQMRLLEDALKEISSSHLYDYDTIVFDIDFSHGVKDVEAISAELLEKIYISPRSLDPLRQSVRSSVRSCILLRFKICIRKNA